MFKTNLKAGIVFKYFDIAEMKNGDWIAWYFHDIDINGLIKDELKKEELKVQKEGKG